MSDVWDDSVDRSEDDLRVVRLCCHYAELRAARDHGGPLSQHQRSQMRRLEQLLGGDPQRRRRRHRRISTSVPAVAATEAGDRHQGMVLNISGGGMYLATAARLPEGTRVMVQVEASGRPGCVFPCIVRRDAAQAQPPGLGLAIASSPREIESWHTGDTTV